jgi:hypothetical protein
MPMSGELGARIPIWTQPQRFSSSVMPKELSAGGSVLLLESSAYSPAPAHAARWPRPLSSMCCPVLTQLCSVHPPSPSPTHAQAIHHSLGHSLTHCTGSPSTRRHIAWATRTLLLVRPAWWSILSKERTGGSLLRMIGTWGGSLWWLEPREVAAMAWFSSGPTMPGWGGRFNQPMTQTFSRTAQHAPTSKQLRSRS